MAGTAHIFVNGVIGEPDFFDFSENNTGNTLADVRRQFNSYENPSEVVVHINSPGGDMDAGLSIHDYISGLQIPKTTIVEGQAYSIATAIMLAGDKGKRLAFSNASIGIHNPYVFTVGEAKDLEKTAAELRRREEVLLNLYVEKTGGDRAKIADWMKDETFFGVQEAIDAGFIDAVSETVLARIEKVTNTPLKAVAFIKIQQEDMNEEAKKASGLIAEIKSLLGIAAKNEIAAASEVKEEVKPEAEEETRDFEAEIAEKNKRIEELEAKLAATETEAQAATEKAETAKEKIQEQAAVIAKIQDKIKALEAMPVLQAQAPEKTFVNREEEAGHYAMYAGAAQALKREYGRVR